MAIEVTDGNITEFLNKKGISVLDFWAPWCGPCKMLGPIIEELANDNKSNDNVSIGKINVDDNAEAAVNYGVRGIPTTIFFKDGKVADKIIGAHSKADFQAKINALLS